MTTPDNNDDESFVPVPATLEHALRRATSRTLTSLAFLRRTLREHVHGERGKGRSLAEIDVEVQALTLRAHEEFSATTPEAGSRDDLSGQMTKWTELYFRTPSKKP
ncbi:MAG TPA: hypothetical protein VGL17_10265 [Gemmatimonadaceae bacterium]